MPRRRAARVVGPLAFKTAAEAGEGGGARKRRTRAVAALRAPDAAGEERAPRLAKNSTAGEQRVGVAVVMDVQCALSAGATSGAPQNLRDGGGFVASRVASCIK